MRRLADALVKRGQLSGCASQDFVFHSKVQWSEKKQAMLPIGNECYYCFDTRRRYFTESFSELQMIRSANPELDKQFMEKRQDKVQGTCLFTDAERVSAKYAVTTKETQFDEAFEEGSFSELFSFARMKHIQSKRDVASVEAAICRAYPAATFGKGKNGEYGVFLPDQPGEACSCGVLTCLVSPNSACTCNAPLGCQPQPRYLSLGT